MGLECGMPFSRQDQLLRLGFSREVLKQSLTQEQNAVLEFPTSKNEPRGVFVTLKKNGKLRGCVGTIESKLSLVDAVRNFTLQSAYSDPRFSPLSYSELEAIQIEISILSPLKIIEKIEEIQPHFHGVYLKNGAPGGLFLPQVWKQLGKLEDFLGELCQSKAGLSPQAWKDPKTEIYSFTVEILEEKGET